MPRTPHQRSRRYAQLFVEARGRKGFTQDEVARHLGRSDRYIRRIETEHKVPPAGERRRLEPYLGISAEDSREALSSEVGADDLDDRKQLIVTSRLSAPTPHNPKPYAIAGCRHDLAYMASGSYTEPMQLRVEYEHAYRTRAPEIDEIYEPLKQRLETEKFARRLRLWDGPTICLSHVDYSLNDNSPAGEEFLITTLHLEPGSWYQYQILNERFIDEPGLIHGQTIRDCYANCDKLFHSDGDYRWCQLSTILTVCLIPITTDGYGVIQFRSSTSVASTPNVFSSGIGENILPFRDEAYSNNLSERIAQLRPEKGVGKSSIASEPPPVGIPSPLLTAQRGMYEEISMQLGTELSLDEYVFLNICWDLSIFNPGLIGIVNTGLRKSQLESIINSTRHPDNIEYDELIYVNLDPDDPITREMLNKNWDVKGLAALITAMNYANNQ